MSFVPLPNRLDEVGQSRSIKAHLLNWAPGAIALSLTAIIPLGVGLGPCVAQTPSPTFPSATQSVNVLVVNSANGNDDTANGSDFAPFKTITKALQGAQSGTVIQLMPGIYSEETGERFPLQLKPGIAIQGDPRNRGLEVIIKGSGFFLSPTSARQSVTVVAANRSSLAGVTIINPHAQGYGLWIESTSPTVTDNTFTMSGHDGISVVGNGAPLIRNNFFSQNGASGITIYGTSRPELRENIFEQNGFAINVNGNAMPLIIGNRITQNKDGVVVQGKSRPILRNNSIEGNQRDGLVAIAQSQPDLGKRGEPGGNFIRNNGQFDINATTSQPVLAFGNELIKTAGLINVSGEELAMAPVAGGGDTPVIRPPAPDSSSVNSTQTPTTMPPVAVRAATSAPTDFPKPPTVLTPTAIAPIPFGEKLSEGTPNTEKQGPAIAPPPIPAPPSNPTPAEAFPMPLSQQPLPQPVTTLPVAEPAPSFPAPTALSGKGADFQPRRPIQIVRIATPETGNSKTSELPGTSAGNFPVPHEVAEPKSTARQPAKPTPHPSNHPTPAQPGSSIPPVPATQPAIPRIGRAASSQMPPAPLLSTSAPPSSPRSLTFTKPLPPFGSPLRASQPTNQTPPQVTSEMGGAPVTSPGRSPSPGAVNPPFRGPVPNAPVAISVPTSETRPVEPPAARTSAPSQAPPEAGTNLLPVPGPNVPIGNVGSRSGIKIFSQANQEDGSAPPVPPNLAGLLGIRYRVVVEADDSQREQIQAIVPDAFPTSFKGRRVFQAGAFGDRDKADQLVQMLLGQGLRATVEVVE